MGCGESVVVDAGTVDLRDGGPADTGPGIATDAGPRDDGGEDAGPDDAGIGFDAGRDAGRDAGADDGGPMDAGRPDLGPMDAGFDAGPLRDAGPDGMRDAGGGCAVGGTYDVTADPMNPPLCGAIPFATCSAVQLSATSVELTCGGVMATCTLDASCVCSGMATASGIAGTIRVDFPAGTVRAVAAGVTCNYEIMLMP